MSLADDGKILAKLPKVKVLRNNQREGGLHLSLSFLQLNIFNMDACAAELSVCIILESCITEVEIV